ncbi:MAG: DNA-binding protein [Erythrobacter sp. 34-65-8]|nr:MAG: DNA-binding protein [Erythrobacter sp. 34-65-8]
MTAGELTRMVRRKPLPAGPMEIVASDAERAALARRFAISAVERLIARVELVDAGSAVAVEGRLEADLVQACAVSGEDFAHTVREPLSFRFVPTRELPDQADIEIELAGDELDDIEYDGDMFDLGEAVAQTLALAIDPYAEGPDADAARKAAGIVTDDTPRGPLADALAALKKT